MSALMTTLKWLGPGRSRQLGRPERMLLVAGACAISALLLAMAFGVYVNSTVALFCFLGTVLSLTFLTTTGNGVRHTGSSPFAWLLAGLSLASCAYFVVMEPVHELRLPMIDPLTPLDMTAAIVLVVLVLEATRRCIGMTLVVLVTAFLAYGVFGDRLGGAFSHRALSAQEIVDQLVFSNTGLVGPALEVAAFLVFVFVMFGALLDRWGGGDFFYDFANSLVGRQVGGAAKVAVVSSGIYGSISGSPTADVVTTGSFTIPLMIRTGLSRAYAAAVESAASTGGAILPPVMGSAAFLMSDFTGIPYNRIVVAAVTPALLYYLAVFLAVHFRAHARGLKPVPAERAVPLGSVLRRDWYYFIPIGLLVWGVLSLDRPAFAGALACAALVPIGLYRAGGIRPFVASLLEGITDGFRRVIGVGVACAVAGLVVGTLSMTDLTGKISSGLFLLASGDYFLTLIVATLVIIVLGMGMPTPAVYALAAVLAAPALTSLGIGLLPAHLFIVYFASMSAITPPVAVAAFAAASIAQDNPIKVAVIACRVAMVAFVLPFIFIYHPALLLVGDPWFVAERILCTTLAVIAASAAIEGWLFARVDPLRRVALFAAAVLLVIPNAVTDYIGLPLLAALVAWLWLTRESAPAALGAVTVPAGDRRDT